MDEICASVILSGVCERHPKLTLVLGESGIGWLPYMLERLDDTSKTPGRRSRARCRRAPTSNARCTRRQGFTACADGGDRAPATSCGARLSPPRRHRPFAEGDREQFQHRARDPVEDALGQRAGHKIARLADSAVNEFARAGATRIYSGHPRPEPNDTLQSMRSDRQRRREIKDYYLGISADEITSYLTPASFDLWQSVARYRRELGIGARWLEIGGGLGDLAATALDHGYDVLMTDVQPELQEGIAAAPVRCPAARIACPTDRCYKASPCWGVTCSPTSSGWPPHGRVEPRARSPRAAPGFGYLHAGGPGALLIVDIMLSEMFAGHPRSIWADILHVLPGFDELARRPGRQGSGAGGALALSPVSADADVRRGLPRADAAPLPAPSGPHAGRAARRSSRRTT
jgi:hypothetical protein